MSTERKKILVTRDMGKEAMSLLQKSRHEVVCWPEDKPAPRSWVLENAKGAHGICVMMADKVNDELLDAAGKSLEIVSTFSVGYDHIDVPAVKKRGVKIGHTPDVLNEAVADITLMLILMATRRAGEAMAIAREGKWPSTPWSPFLLTGPALSKPGLVIGFLGFGRISQSTLRRMKAFTRNPECIYTSSKARTDQESIDERHSKEFGLPVKRVEIDDLARRSDVLVVLCSLNESTKNLVNEPFLKKMKPEAVLVNTARGGIVDSDALARALETGQIFGAGVDVVEGEPNIQADHPLLKQPRCVVLPHIGSASDESRKGMADLCARNVLEGIEGQALPAEVV